MGVRIISQIYWGSSWLNPFGAFSWETKWFPFGETLGIGPSTKLRLKRELGWETFFN